MDYKRLIRSWHLKASEEDYFSKFVFEYLAFIAYLKTQSPYDKSSDRSAIQSLKRDDEIKNEYLIKVENDINLNSSWLATQDELKEKPLGNVSRDPDNTEEIVWWNCSRGQLRDKTEEEWTKEAGVLHSLEDWENMVEFWYSIRNNLFHGTKDPEVKRDKKLVEFGYKTLSPLMQIFISRMRD
ncbi:MAG: hypothetical protein FJ123_01605 [Deltaproteobacteria bacterium]|nr:hypothetical protein [Deltaproteobacteria bacterium]